MRTALITGASSGIGAETVKRLLEEKWKVILVARSTANMKEIVYSYSYSHSDSSPIASKTITHMPKKSKEKHKPQCECYYSIISFDLMTNVHQIESNLLPMIQQSLQALNSEAIDLLFNNAGIALGVNINACLYPEMLNVMNVNCFAASLLIKCVQPYLKHSKMGASVVNNGSTLGGALVANNVFPYALSKSAMAFMTKSWATELAQYNIRVNYLTTAAVNSGIHARIFGAEEAAKFLAGTVNKIPLQRIGDMVDVVEMVMFLADTQKSGWITGELIGINGGRTLAKL